MLGGSGFREKLKVKGERLKENKTKDKSLPCGIKRSYSIG